MPQNFPCARSPLSLRIRNDPSEPVLTNSPPEGLLGLQSDNIKDFFYIYVGVAITNAIAIHFREPIDDEDTLRIDSLNNIGE